MKKIEKAKAHLYAIDNMLDYRYELSEKEQKDKVKNEIKAVDNILKRVC